MMEQNESAQGVIGAVNQWKSGKGCFVKLNENDADFFKFGVFVSKPGDFVRLHIKQGTGNYSDKYEILRTEKLEAGETTAQKPASGQDFKQASLPTQKPVSVDDTKGRILRSVTLKCATQLHAATLKVGDRTSVKEMVLDVIETASQLESYITGTK